jgi:hypothetical protein
MEKLKPNEYWLFLVWMPYFFFKLSVKSFFGEDIFYHAKLTRSDISMDSKWIPMGDLSYGYWLAYRNYPLTYRIHRAIRGAEKKEYMVWNSNPWIIQWKWIFNGSSGYRFLRKQ